MKRKLFNILIVAYVLTCMLVGGIIKLKVNCKAYIAGEESNGHMVFGGSNFESAPPSGSYNFSIIQNTNRGIYVNVTDFEQTLGNTFTSGGVAYITNGDFTLSYSDANNISPGWVNGYIENNYDFYYGEWLGQHYELPQNTRVTYFYYNRIIHYDAGDTVVTRTFSGNVDYCKNIDDAIKYLNGDNSVVLHGDPNHIPVTLDNTLPVPQQLSSTYKSGNNSYPPHLRGTWVNPDNASFNAIKSDIYIEVQYKPKFQFYASNSLFRKKYKVAESSEYLNIYNDKLEELYQFVKYGAEDGLYPGSNEFSINSSYLNDIRSAFPNELQYINVKESTIDVGSKWRARYYYYKNGDKLTSYWSVYNVNQKNPIDNNKNSVTFQDSSGNPVSPDEVDYQNSTDTEESDNLTLSNFFSNLSNSISNLFSTINNFFMFDGDSGNFMSFFSSVFKYFPQLLTLFMLGLVIVIMLRILGR